jgi:transcriptional regulator with XRE-family HTH domain
MSQNASKKSEDSAIAKRIGDLRRSLGMNQTQFSKALNTRPSTVSKWESGFNKPSPDVFVRLAKLADGQEKLFFLEEAGVPLEYFDGAPMIPEMREAATQIVAKTLRRGAATLGEYSMGDDPFTIHLLKNPQKLGELDALQPANVELALNLPTNWFPSGASVQAVRFHGEFSPLICGELIALVDVSRKDPDRLLGCIVAVRTSSGVEPMTLRRDGRTYLLVPLHETAEHSVKVLRHEGVWSIMGKVLKWIGDAPAGK